VVQRDQLPEAIHELVLDDQRFGNEICWSVLTAECVAAPGPPQAHQANAVNLLVRLNLGDRNACPVTSFDKNARPGQGLYGSLSSSRRSCRSVGRGSYPRWKRTCCSRDRHGTTAPPSVPLVKASGG